MKCILCNTCSLKEVLRIKKLDRFEKYLNFPQNSYSRKWMLCKTCMICMNFYPDRYEEKIDTIASDYYKIDFPKHDLLSRFNSLNNLSKSESDNFHRVKRVGDFICKNTNGVNLVDVGCGTGIFPYQLDKYLKINYNRPYSIIGIEQSKTAMNFIRKNKIALVKSNLNQFKNKGNFSFRTREKPISIA